jgi:hypothetical protein
MFDGSGVAAGDLYRRAGMSERGGAADAFRDLRATENPRERRTPAHRRASMSERGGAADAFRALRATGIPR